MWLLGVGLGDYSENVSCSYSDQVPDAPGQDSRGQEEGQVIRHAVAAVDRRQEAAIEAGADKTTTFPVLAEANRSEGMSGGMDEVLEGVPAYPAVEEEEEDEDWQFTLPKGTLEDDDDDDMDRTQPTEESQRSGIDQEFEKVVQLEKASGPANHSSPVSSDGAIVEQSKEPEANQVEKISKEPAEAPPQGTASDAPILSIKDEPVDEGYDAALLPQSSISKIKEELEHKEILVKGQTAFQRKGATQLFCSTVCLSSHLPPTSKARSCYHCNKEIDDPKSMVMVPLDNNTFMHFCSPLCLSLSSTDRKKTVAQLLYSPRLMPRIASEKERLQCIVCKSTSKIEHEVTHQGHVHSLCSNACFLAWRKSRQLAMNCCEGCGLYCKSDSDVCQTLTVEKAQLHFCSPTCVSTYKQSCMRNTECTVCHKSIPVSNAIMERDPMGKVQLYCSPACVGQSGPAKHMLTGTAFPCSQCNLNKVPQYHLATADGKIRNFCSYECVSVFRIKKGESISQPNPVNGTTSSPSYSSSQPSLTDGPLPGPVRGAESSAPAHGRALPLVASPSPHHSVTAVPPLEPPYSDLASQAPLAPPSSPGHALTQTTPPHGQLTCHQCSKLFDTKPLLFSYQYKAQKNIMAQCESCKLENVVFEVLTYNEQDRIFCSQSCKQQFQDEVTAGSNGSWRPCSYCYCVSQKRLHSHYNGRVEEFCRAHCMSQYTVLYYGMARCDSCRTQGYMAEQLRCTSSVRNFCTRACLAQYCYQHFEAGAQHTANHATRTLPPPHAPSQAHHPSKMNPVVGDVVSLASDSAARPHGSEALAGQFTLYLNASTQTDAMRLPVARRCQVKNKSVLCRPFTLNQETMCQLLEPPVKTSESSTMTLQGPLPARLSGRHFLDMRQGGSVDCVVCSQHKRKRVNGGQEEGHTVGKRGRMEESGKVRVEETGKVGEPKLVVEKFEEEKQLKECTESEMKEKERGETSRPAQEIRCCSERRVKVKEEKEVKIEMGVGVARRLTAYHCKTCPEQPALCPAPCFELYHTRLLYSHTPAELGTAGQHHTPCDELITAHASVPLPPPATCDPTQTNTVKANSGPQ
ncbi:unnamed protein product [Merluccius merluccius]